MNQERISEIYGDCKKALGRLSEAMREDLAKGSIVVDGTIQRFEFTFELAWKLAKAILNYKGIDVATPRDAIKEAFKTGIIKDGDGWIDMLGDRNKTSHIYDEAEAMVIYKKIRDNHFQLLDTFLQNAVNFIK